MPRTILTGTIRRQLRNHDPETRLGCFGKK